MDSKQLLFSVPFINLNGQFLLLLSYIGGVCRPKIGLHFQVRHN
jgi:hypothetical protein